MAHTQRLPLAGLARRVGQLAHHVPAHPTLDGLGRARAAVQQDEALHTLLVE